MRVSEFDFELPEEQIAQQPPLERAGARMLTLNRETGDYTDGWFRDLPELLRPGDLLVLNDSRVIPARLFARRATNRNQSTQQPSGQIEVLLTGQVSQWEWKALVKPGRKVRAADRLLFNPASPSGREHSVAYANPTRQAESLLEAEVLEHGEFGERLLRFAPVPDFFERIDRLGHVPLPPYIHRQDSAADRERYQTIYARQRGSVAAPTAGLHFSPEILEQVRARGVQIAYVTLHVGLGTFQPVRVERLEDIKLHAENYTLPAETAVAVNLAISEGRRIIAAGTTTVRTLEHCALTANGAPLHAHSGSTSIFISPCFQFRVVTALLTNFHLPQSSLLMLVSAFAGHESAMTAYRHAVSDDYRFFSYGDCMFIS